MYSRLRAHTDKHRSWLSQWEKLDALLLHRGSLAFLIAAVVVFEKQLQPEMK